MMTIYFCIMHKRTTCFSTSIIIHESHKLSFSIPSSIFLRKKSILNSQASILYAYFVSMVSWYWRIENRNFSQRIENDNATCKCFYSQFDVPKVIVVDGEFSMINNDENKDRRENND